MSEPVAKPRPFSSGDETWPHRVEASSTNAGDPLAELARLVGRDDPFRDIFPSRSAQPVREPVRLDRPTRILPPDDASDGQGGTRIEAHDQRYDTYQAGFSGQPSSVLERPKAAHQDSLRFPVLGHDTLGYDAADGDAFGAAPQAEAPPLNADLWAQGMPEPDATSPIGVDPQDGPSTMRDGGSQRRTLVVLAAVVALTAGGLGTTFLLRGGHSQSTDNSGGVPTIMADQAPTKVQPPEVANAGTGGDGNTALLERSASDNVSHAKVVDTQERPIDLAQLPKGQQADDGRAGSAASGSSFPEPRKVKTVLIRPDGTVVGQDTPAVPAASAATVAAAAAAATPFADTPSTDVPAPVSAEPAARAATPKSTARVAATTPKSTTVDGVAQVKPKLPHATAKAKPVETADAAETPADTTAATSGGGFAVQLAAPASEQEAKDAASRLQKKFGEALGSHKASFKKADKGAASVYRVRVGNLSQDDAKAMCGKIQSGGGSCFVVRN